MLTRDHHDMGSCVRRLGALGRIHNFQTVNPEPDASRHCRDDQDTTDISWPNYHSGANGDYQTIIKKIDSHPLLRREDGSEIEFLPSHTHEGAVSAPPEMDDVAHVLMTGTSLVSGRKFNLAVVLDGECDETGALLGRAVCQSTFHHFADPNLDPDAPMPSFVAETSGSGIANNSQALNDVQQYIRNIAGWLT